MEKMSKKKFIRLVMSAANEVVKHFSEGTKTIEAEIPSGTKTELVSIVVSGRRGWYETFHGIKRMPVFISTRLTLNGAQGEIVFWGNDVPPELRDLTAKELSKKGYQIGPALPTTGRLPIGYVHLLRGKANLGTSLKRNLERR